MILAFSEPLVQKSLRQFGRRKQAFFFTHTPSFLVSDDDKDGGYQANQGITLPDGEEATHSIYLSPIFMTTSSRASYTHDSNTIAGRGREARYWASTNHLDSCTNSSIVRINNQDQSSVAFSLRCLVSTANS